MLSLHYEYKVVPAPRRAAKSLRAKTIEERFALAVAEVMNTLGRDGWEYLRADALPVDERAGLTGGVKTSYQNLLVFRRVKVAANFVPDDEAYNEDLRIAPPLRRRSETLTFDDFKDVTPPRPEEDGAAKGDIAAE